MEENINTILPHLVLRNIFSKLDSADVINSGSVCTLWRDHQFALTKIKDSLIILIGTGAPFDVVSKSIFTIPHLEEVLDEDSKPMYSRQNGTKRSSLSYPSAPSQEVTDQIINAFPFLTKLTIVIDDIKFSKVADFFVQVMQSWSEKLTALEIFFRSKNIRDGLMDSEDFDYFAEIESSKAIMSTIGFFKFLKHLTIDCDTYFFIKKSPKHIFDLIGDLPPNLSTLKFRSLDYIEGQNLETLHGYLEDSEDQLIHLALLNPTAEAMNSSKWLRFASKWTTKPSNVGFWDETKFSTFPSLSSISINYHFGLDLTQIFNSLSLLNKLVYLCLTIGLKGDVSNVHQLDMAKYESFYCPKINPLNTVKVLKLKLLNLQYHFDIQSSIWSHVFPAVQVIIIKHKCTKYCHHYRNMQIKVQFVDDIQLIESIRRMIKTFKNCPKLRYIYTNYPVKKRWAVSDLK